MCCLPFLKEIHVGITFRRESLLPIIPSFACAYYSLHIFTYITKYIYSLYSFFIYSKLNVVDLSSKWFLCINLTWRDAYIRITPGIYFNVGKKVQSNFFKVKEKKKSGKMYNTPRPVFPFVPAI